MLKVSTIQTMDLNGGIDCLDFINSGYDLQKGVITERIDSYEDLMILSGRLGLFEDPMIQDLRKSALANNQAAEEVVVMAKRTRNTLYQLFEIIVNQSGRNIDQGLLMKVNCLITEAMQFYQLESTGEGLRFSFQANEAGLMAPIWKLVLSARDLLTEGKIEDIKQCHRCSWFFLDKTKNHRKKWCSMESCGNSQKTKRYYRNRKHQEGVV